LSSDGTGLDRRPAGWRPVSEAVFGAEAELGQSLKLKLLLFSLDRLLRISTE